MRSTNLDTRARCSIALPRSRYRINDWPVGQPSRELASAWLDIWDDGVFRTAQIGGRALVAYGLSPRGAAADRESQGSHKAYRRAGRWRHPHGWPDLRGRGDQDGTRGNEALFTALRADPSNWSVGDNLEWDVEAPQSHGAFGIWVDVRGAGLPASAAVQPDRIIRSIAELLES